MCAIRLITGQTDPFYPQALQLRQNILRLPIGLNLFDEDLAAEFGQTTTLVYHQGCTVLACVLLEFQPFISNNNEIGTTVSTFKLKQMAVSPEHQGKQIGKKLVTAAEEFAKKHEISKIHLHARVAATGFYGKLGYEIKGEEFLEVGIPHLYMEKMLK